MESFIGLDVEQSRSKISLHLNSYIQETLDIYEEHPDDQAEATPMQQGNVQVLTSADVPVEPEKHKQAFYRSMVALLQFAGTWVRFNISYTVGQLTHFCASAGSSHSAALHHLVEYLRKHPSFNRGRGHISASTAT